MRDSVGNSETRIPERCSGSINKQEINASCIGKKVYVLTEYGGWYGQIKDAYEDSFLVANTRNGRESVVDIFNVRWPEDPVLE